MGANGIHSTSFSQPVLKDNEKVVNIIIVFIYIYVRTICCVAVNLDS